MTAQGNRTPLSVGNPIDGLFEMFEDNGNACYLGEDVTMAEHMLQAAHVAADQGASGHLIIAALLHDIGHFVVLDAEAAQAAEIDRNHETAGAQVLTRTFPDSISEPVRLHVLAKRYLCTIDAAYMDKLSPASVKTFHMQGGAMTAAERTAFESNAHAADAIFIRKCEERGKVGGWSVPALSTYRLLLDEYLAMGSGS